MSNVFHELFSKHGELVKECATLKDFIAVVSVSGQMRAYLESQQNDYNDRMFRTWKAHGYSSRALAFPEVKSVKELFESARLVDISIGNGQFRDVGIRMAQTEGFAFAASTRTKTIPFGTVGFCSCIREDARQAGKLFCYSLRGNGKTLGTYLKPQPALFRHMLRSFEHKPNAMMEFSCIYSFDFISRDNGTSLLISRWHIGEDWLAILDTATLKKEIEDLIPADQMAEYNAAREADALARSCVDDNGMIDKEKAKRLGVEVFIDR